MTYKSEGSLQKQPIYKPLRLTANPTSRTLKLTFNYGPWESITGKAELAISSLDLLFNVLPSCSFIGSTKNWKSHGNFSSLFKHSTASFPFLSCIQTCFHSSHFGEWKGLTWYSFCRWNLKNKALLFTRARIRIAWIYFCKDRDSVLFIEQGVKPFNKRLLPELCSGSTPRSC